MQASVSIALPKQGAPPFSSSFTFDLLLDFSPLPQVLEHELHSSKSAHRQSTDFDSTVSIAQVTVLQASISIELPTQGTPPFSSSFTFERLLDFSPLPHVLEHALHSSNSSHKQSTNFDSPTVTTLRLFSSSLSKK